MNTEGWDEVGVLRVTVNATARWGGRPLYRAVVEEARARGLAGASVFPVETGYGRRRVLRDAASDYEGPDAPVCVEIVDTRDRLRSFLAAVAPALDGGFWTLEPAHAAGFHPHPTEVPHGEPPVPGPDA